MIANDVIWRQCSSRWTSQFQCQRKEGMQMNTAEPAPPFLSDTAAAHELAVRSQRARRFVHGALREVRSARDNHDALYPPLDRDRPLRCAGSRRPTPALDAAHPSGILPLKGPSPGRTAVAAACPAPTRSFEMKRFAQSMGRDAISRRGQDASQSRRGARVQHRAWRVRRGGSRGRDCRAHWALS